MPLLRGDYDASHAGRLKVHQPSALDSTLGQTLRSQVMVPYKKGSRRSSTSTFYLGYSFMKS
jgi:hypothetical protein